MVNQLEQTNETLAIAHGSQQNIHYVTQNDVEQKTAKEAYYKWLSRLVIFFTILSVGFFASASLVLFKLAPQVTVEPFLIIKQDDSSQMVRYEPIAKEMASNQMLMESFMKQYVTLRNTIINDANEMETRWMPGGMVNYFSSPKIFDEFYRKEVDQKMKKYATEKLVREVEILSIGKVGGENSRVWKIDFKTYDLTPKLTNDASGSMLLRTKYWTASISATFVPDRIFIARRLMNPVGFTVIQYSQAEVEIL